MPVYNQGNINLDALTLSDIYVVINPPQALVIPGVPTSIAGVVGTASWGPVNVPVVVGNPGDLQNNFGPILLDPNDLVTDSLMALKQGANNLRCVRVTDGTDVKATAAIKDTAGTPVTVATLTAKYSGVLGNSLSVTTGPGTKANTFKVIIQMPGFNKEIFDNIAGLGATLAANIVTALNSGQGGVRPPSNFVTAATSYGGSLGLATATTAFSSGTNGNGGVNTASLVGTDGSSSTRTGMYALRGTGLMQFILAGCFDKTSWPTQVTFGVSEGCFPIMTDATGTSSSAYIADIATEGVDNWQAAFVKDWIYINDTVNNLQRLVSPLGFALGLIATLSPEQSPGNKQLYGIVATERTQSGLPYSDAELSTLEQAGIMPITNPVPAGKFFGLRNGQNASSNPTTNGINYTRMTLFIAYSLNNVLGKVVCAVQTPQLRHSVLAAYNNFCANLQRLNMIGDVNGGPGYFNQCDKNNNPDSQVALGYLTITSQIKYLSIARFIVTGLQGGQTVQPQVLSTLGGNS